MVNFFGIRHLSPAGAYHLRNYLEEKRPRVVLIEGPCDLNDQMEFIAHAKTKPPIAILAYTKEVPVRTILYPYAEYSPEYQAVCWCKEHTVECRFIDLPSEVFLALSGREYLLSNASDTGKSDVGESVSGKSDAGKYASGAAGNAFFEQGEESKMDVYDALDSLVGEDGHETFWERVLEHAQDAESYRHGANLFGANIRELSWRNEHDRAETLVRESFMCRKIKDAVDEGYAQEEIVVVTGAYHVEGLKGWEGQSELVKPMTDAEMKILPRVESSHTLMPYSYYRLSSRAGYGAGNKAPAYYSLLWEARKRNQLQYTAYKYLSKIAAFQRGHGTPVSSAEVIEAVRLANALAAMREGSAPVLRDLRDAAVTCLGGGSFSAISFAVAHTEIGPAVGELPEGVSKTSIQEDFNRQMKQLKLEKFRSLTAQDLKLDLRENRMVSSEKAAFMDLYRSYFLHRLAVLGISAAQKQKVNQENATWSELWTFRWIPEAEIELVEAALKGDTVMQAVSFCMKERIENAKGMSDIALAIEDSFCCGLEEIVAYATAALQAMAVDAASLEDLAMTAHRLSVVIQYGNIRRLDAEPLIPVLKQIFYRSCLILPAFCVCDDNGSKSVIQAMESLNQAALAHEWLEQEAWVQAITEVAQRDDLNTKISGFSAAILLERGLMDVETLQLEVSRRLSKGTPADLGAGWFEGLSMKNRYALIARLSLWENLDHYLDTLDDEEFKRALVFLRRAFADFTSLEKDQIAENLGEIWDLNGQQVSEAVNMTLDEETMELLDGLDDFDFDF